MKTTVRLCSALLALLAAACATPPAPLPASILVPPDQRPDAVLTLNAPAGESREYHTDLDYDADKIPRSFHVFLEFRHFQPLEGQNSSFTLCVKLFKEPQKACLNIQGPKDSQRLALVSSHEGNGSSLIDTLEQAQVLPQKVPSAGVRNIGVVFFKGGVKFTVDGMEVYRRLMPLQPLAMLSMTCSGAVCGIAIVDPVGPESRAK
jgi:hypothetical protein